MKVEPSRTRRLRSLKALSDLFRQGDSFILTTHHHPDGDALGSLLATYHLLRWLKKQVWVYFPHEVPPNLQFLPGIEHLQREIPGGSNPGSFLVLLDCGSPERVSEEFPRILQALKFPCIVIDHHRTERPFGEFSWVDPDASATGEIIFSLASALAYPLTPEFACCVYTAIFTDTGSFRFSNTTARALAIASRLVRAGAHPQKIAEEIYENQSEARLRLLAEALSTLELLYENRVAIITLRREVLERYKGGDNSLEGFIDYPRSLRGVRIAIQFREVEPGREFKASMRSKGKYDVEEIARRFGGGGHQHAAGCTLYGTYEEVRRKLLAVVEEELRRHDRS